MATSSIFNNIRVKDAASCRRLVDAMESSMKAKPKKVVLRHEVVEPDDAKIKELFKEK
jgi:hypothetical protein